MAARPTKRKKSQGAKPWRGGGSKRALFNDAAPTPMEGVEATPGQISYMEVPVRNTGRTRRQAYIVDEFGRRKFVKDDGSFVAASSRPRRVLSDAQQLARLMQVTQAGYEYAPGKFYRSAAAGQRAFTRDINEVAAPRRQTSDAGEWLNNPITNDYITPEGKRGVDNRGTRLERWTDPNYRTKERNLDLKERYLENLGMLAARDDINIIPENVDTYVKHYFETKRPIASLTQKERDAFRSQFGHDGAALRREAKARLAAKKAAGDYSYRPRYDTRKPRG